MKKFLMVILALALLFSVAACEKQVAPAEEQATEAVAAPAEDTLV